MLVTLLPSRHGIIGLMVLVIQLPIMQLSPMEAVWVIHDIFTATFQNQIDIAILSDYSYGVSQIKRDLSILGLTYTKFEMSDWDSYLDSNWLSVYDKIVLPWQDQSHSASIDDGGYGYYEIIGSSQNKTILENFMSSGGTLQVHLQENEQHYEYSTVTGESYLPLNMQIESRTNGDEVKAQDLEPVDIYHPIFRRY